MYTTRSYIWMAAALVAAGTAGATPYKQTHRCGPENFAQCFNFFTDPDPTNGFVEYVNQSHAQATGLYRTTANSVRMGADAQNTYPLSSAGRQSLRLESTFTQTHGLYILDLNHMPAGCGTWPAFWTLGPDWPHGGEIDIIEGVNNAAQNLATLHTDAGCTIAGAAQSGELLTSDCNVRRSNTGCGTRAAPNTPSYGAPFNAAGGGVYAMEWTSAAIRIWFFARGHEPASLRAGAPDPGADFGLPQADMAGACDVDAHFRQHKVIFDLTFCGDWAGGTYAQSGCPMTPGKSGRDSCNAFVAGNPAAFRDAFWDIRDLRVYAAAGDAGADGAGPAVPAAPPAPASPAPAPAAPPALASLAPAPVAPSAATSPAPASAVAPAAPPGAPEPAAPPAAPLATAAPAPAPAAPPAPASPAPAPAAPSAAPPAGPSATSPAPPAAAASQAAAAIAAAASPASPAPPAAATGTPAPAPAAPAPTTLRTSLRTVEAHLVNTDAAGVVEQLAAQTLITQVVDHFRRGEAEATARGGLVT